MTMPAETPAVFLSDDDWRVIVRELRDQKQHMLEVERDHPNHPRIANAARVEAERIGDTLRRVLAQIVVNE